jgi:hypothetical protein
MRNSAFRTPHSALARPGLSLAEVLIAMFVLALGLLGVLSLFPLGAVRMAQAIKDDRSQNHNLNTAAQFHVIWKLETVSSNGNYRQMYPSYYNPGPNTTPTQSDIGDRIDPLTCAMEDPNYPPNPDGSTADYNAWIPQNFLSPIYPSPGPPQPTVTGTQAMAVVSRGTLKKSYCVYVDPVGWNNNVNNGTAKQYWLAGRIDSIPRRSLRRIEWAKNPSLPAPQNGLYTLDLNTAYGFDIKRVLRNRYMVLLEDIGFGLDGTPLDSTGQYTSLTNPAGLAGMVGQIQRDGRYSCGIMFRRPQAYVVRQVEMQVVVYSGRSQDGPSDEFGYTTRFTKGSTEATVYWDPATQTRPRIRKNSWLLDGTMVWQQPNPNGTFNPNGPLVPDNGADRNHGVFYRVVDLVEDTEIVNGTQFSVFRIQLQEPAQSNAFYNDGVQTASGVGTPYGIGVVMDNVVEVFPAKTLSPLTRPTP